jgi:hypothetical protein
MDGVLDNLPSTVAYQNDILFRTASKDLVHRVSAVLEILEDENITVNAEEPLLVSAEFYFLGHLITSVCIRPGPQIAEKILSRRSRTNDRKELQ